MKLLNSVRLVTLASAAVLVGCQDTDYDFEKNYISEDAKAFIEAFEDRYGYIDPTHTFNDAYYGSVEVTTDESAVVTVSAFIDSQTEATILAQAVVKGTQTIEYDYPNGTARVFVIAKCNGETNGEVMAPGKGNKVSFSFAGTRAEFSTTPDVQTTATLVKTVDGFYTTTDGKNFTQNTTNNPTSEEILFDITEWTGRFYLTSTPGEVSGDYAKSSISSKTLSTLAEFWEEMEDKDFIKQAASNISFQVTADGPISLTGVSATTASHNAIGYFFTDANNNNLNGFKKADKFILIPDSKEESIKGNKYYLTYYPNKNSDGIPTDGTHIIPKGKIVHFFLIRTESNYGSGSTDYLHGNMMWSSEPEITKLTADYYNSYKSYGFMTGDIADLATTASYTYNGFMCLSFEDWPNGAESDWNDCVFTLDGNITNGEETKTKKMNTFTVAVEDLGVADDTDYNDVVFTVSQSYETVEEENEKGETTTTVKYDYPKLTFLCAGGTLPLCIYYKDGDKKVVIVDEIHKAFGCNNTEYMINTGGDGASTTGTIVEKNTFTKELEVESFLTEPLKMSKHASNFYIEITKKDGTKLHVNANSNDTDKENNSNYPFVLVIPTDSWEFPKERQNIDLVYNGFKDWVNSQYRGYFWYDSNAREVQNAESALSDGASSTLSVETTSTSTSDLKYGDNDLATTVELDQTYKFEDWNFLRQTDNLSYKMLATINPKTDLDIETIWGSQDYGTVTIHAHNGKTISYGSIEKEANKVTFKNVPARDLAEGFTIHNTNSEIRLQSMTIKCYKSAEKYNLTIDGGTYTYYPLPENITYNSNQNLGYKVLYTLGDGVANINVAAHFTGNMYGVIITDLEGNLVKSMESTNNDYTEWSLTLPVSDNITGGFYITSTNSFTTDTLSTIDITPMEEVIEGVVCGTLALNQTYTYSDNLVPISSTGYGQYYKFNYELPEGAVSMKVEIEWTNKPGQTQILDMNGTSVYYITPESNVVVCENVNISNIANAFYITSYQPITDNALKSVKITVNGSNGNNSGSGDNTLIIGDNTLETPAYSENSYGEYYYDYQFKLPTNATKITIKSVWSGKVIEEYEYYNVEKEVSITNQYGLLNKQSSYSGDDNIGYTYYVTSERISDINSYGGFRLTHYDKTGNIHLLEKIVVTVESKE